MKRGAMKYLSKISYPIILILVGLWIGTHSAKFLPATVKDNAIPYAAVLFLGIFATWLVDWVKNKLLFIWQLRNMKENIDGESLKILAHQRGLPFVFLKGVDDSALRYLISLKMVRAAVYPGELNYTYYLTDWGRLLLERELDFGLCPLEFCEMYLIRFSRGYADQFAREALQFKLKNRISWKRAWNIFGDILRNELGEQGFPVKDENLVPLFDSYLRNNGFSAVMDKLIRPWEEQVDRERMKSFRLYFPKLAV